MIWDASIVPVYALTGRRQSINGTFLPRPLNGLETSGMSRRTPKQILEWLCEGLPEYWRRDKNDVLAVNVYKLAKDLRRTVERNAAKDLEAPSQSTLARGYAGETESFSEPILALLSEHFSVPAPLIRGEVDLDSLEAWGMDITIAELRVLALVRKLEPSQRKAVYELLHTMLPDEPPLVAPIPPPNVMPFDLRRRPRPPKQ